MEEVKARLEAVKPEIEEIMSIAGVVGLCYGIVHQGQIVHVGSLGYRDIQEKLKVDEETIFPCCSMTKGLVTSVLGMLVDERKLDFNDYVHNLLPTFKSKSKSLQELSRLSDWLSMHIGAQSYQCWFQSQNNIMVDKDDAMKVINNLQSHADLRTQFTYNNWRHKLASQVITQLTHETWDSLVHKRIFQPLGLKQSDAQGDLKGVDNVSQAYTILDDTTPILIPQTPISGATINGAAGGVKSCIKDLLVLYQNVLDACIDQFKTGKTATEGSVFKNLITTMSPQNNLPGKSLREQTYGMGWIRTQLPNQMCRISPNLDLLGEEPILGDGAPSKLSIAHYGSMPGAYCGVNLFPKTNSLVVMLSNTTPMCDSADWIIQVLVRALFGFPKSVDYVDWVQRTVNAELEWYPRTKAELERKRLPDTSPKALHEYVGEYFNEAGYFLLSVKNRGEELVMAFQGRQDEEFELEHYEHDTFCWLKPRNDLVERGRWVGQPGDYYLLRFGSGGEKGIDRVTWRNDPNLRDGEVFFRR